jgi:hypothetical protein
MNSLMRDPDVPDWVNLELPDSWADQLKLPSAEQLHGSFWSLLRKHGWRGVYFNWLARVVCESFVRAWHKIDLQRALDEAGFVCVSDEEHFPTRMVLARRKPVSA